MVLFAHFVYQLKGVSNRLKYVFSSWFLIIASLALIAPYR